MLKVSRDSHIKVAVGKAVVITPAAWQRFCQSEVVICIRDAADMLSLQTVLHAVMQGICQTSLLLLIGSSIGWNDHAGLLASGSDSPQAMHPRLVSGSIGL